MLSSLYRNFNIAPSIPSQNNPWAAYSWCTYDVFLAGIHLRYHADENAMVNDCFKEIIRDNIRHQIKKADHCYRFLSEQITIIAQMPDLRNEIIKTLLERVDVNFSDLLVIGNCLQTLAKLITLMSIDEQQLLLQRSRRFRQECIEQSKNGISNDKYNLAILNKLTDIALAVIRTVSVSLFQAALRCYPGVFCEETQTTAIDPPRALELFTQIPPEAAEFGEAQFWLAKLHCSHSIFTSEAFRLPIMNRYLKTAAATGHELAKHEKVAIDAQLKQLLAPKSTRGGISFFIPVNETQSNDLDGMEQSSISLHSGRRI